MIERRALGLNYSGGIASFCVWAPYANSVLLKSSDLTLTLRQKQPGYWEDNGFYIEPGSSYSLILDGKSLPDPASLYQSEGISGDSVAFDLCDHTWNDSSWMGIPMEDLIIYEIHTGTFTKEGTFEAAGEKIGYLKELGITAVELMPVAQFPGTRNWGYDGVFPFAVQNSYGGPIELQKLVDKCHQNGIAVILDVVINHIGPEGNILNEFGPFFTDKYKTPWGQAVNYDDAGCDGVRLFFTENILMWMRDFHIDGIRLDAVHAIKDFSPKNILQEIRENVDLLNSHTSGNFFLIGECDLNDVRYIAPINKCGYGLNAIWCDEFHHALHSLITNEKSGYYSDFGNIWHLIKSYNDAFVYDGIWSDHRQRVFGTRTAGYSGHKFVVFSQNHDQVGNRMYGDRLSSTVSFEQKKLIAGAVLFSPFIPLLFMGEEYAEENPFLYFTSHQGTDLIKLVREGRRTEFKDFYKEDELPDPQDQKTFEESKLKQSELSKHELALFNFYKNLIFLRKSIPLWKDTERKNFSAESLEGKNVLQLTRKNNSQILLAILNFEDSKAEVITCKPYIQWELLLNSSDVQWGGPGIFVDPEKPSISVPPQSIIVLYST